MNDDGDASGAPQTVEKKLEKIPKVLSSTKYVSQPGSGIGLASLALARRSADRERHAASNSKQSVPAQNDLQISRSKQRKATHHEETNTDQLTRKKKKEKNDETSQKPKGKEKRMYEEEDKLRKKKKPKTSALARLAQQNNDLDGEFNGASSTSGTGPEHSDDEDPEDAEIRRLERLLAGGNRKNKWKKEGLNHELGLYEGIGEDLLDQVDLLLDGVKGKGKKKEKGKTKQSSSSVLRERRPVTAEDYQQALAEKRQRMREMGWQSGEDSDGWSSQVRVAAAKKKHFFQCELFIYFHQILTHYFSLFCTQTPKGGRDESFAIRNRK